MTDDMKPHDKIHAAQSLLFSVQHNLNRLAMSFEETGNLPVADRLDTWAADCAEASRLVREATGQMLNEQVREAQQGTVNMLRLSLALLAPQPPENAS